MLLINTLDGISMLLTPTANVVRRFRCPSSVLFVRCTLTQIRLPRFRRNRRIPYIVDFYVAQLAHVSKIQIKLWFNITYQNWNFFLKRTRDEVKREINLFTFNGKNKSKHNNRLLQHARPCMTANRVLLYIFNPENIAKQWVPLENCNDSEERNYNIVENVWIPK